MFKVNEDEQNDLECPKIMILKDFIIETPIYYTFLESLWLAECTNKAPRRGENEASVARQSSRWYKLE